MRVLALTRYARQGASSRVRFYHYLPWLEAAGIGVTLAPFFTDRYIQALQGGRKSLREIVSSYPERVFKLLGRHTYDMLWIEKELFPWVPAFVEVGLLKGEVPYVLDYDDAVFHSVDEHESAWVRSLLGGKYRHLMSGSALVVAGNSYLAAYARRAGARNIQVLPTVVDLMRYRPAMPKEGAFENPRIGWIGQRATAKFLSPYSALFRSLSEAGVAHFAVIGAEPTEFAFPAVGLPWAEGGEVEAISSFDIGIMPLVDEPFERGKCGYKLIQYMACALPVIASPVGVNCEIVEHGVNGFLAETAEDWHTAITTLVRDPQLRLRMGLAGRKKVEDQYSLQVAGPRLVELFSAVAPAGRANR